MHIKSCHYKDMDGDRFWWRIKFMIAMSFMQFINCSLSNFGQPYQIKNKKSHSLKNLSAPKCTNNTNSRFFFFFAILYFSCPWFLQSLDSREKCNLLLQKTGKLNYHPEKERAQSQQEQCSCLLKPRRNCQEKGCYYESAGVSEGQRGEEVLQLLNSSIFPGSDRGFLIRETIFLTIVRLYG